MYGVVESFTLHLGVAFPSNPSNKEWAINALTRCLGILLVILVDNVRHIELYEGPIEMRGLCWFPLFPLSGVYNTRIIVRYTLS